MFDIWRHASSTNDESMWIHTGIVRTSMNLNLLNVLIPCQEPAAEGGKIDD